MSKNYDEGTFENLMKIVLGVGDGTVPEAAPRISSEGALKEVLDLHDIADLGTEEGQGKLVAHIDELEPSFLDHLLEAVPSLSGSLLGVVETAATWPVAFAATKRARWEALTECARCGQMTGAEFIEAIEIIAELEAREADRMRYLGLGVAGVAGAILGVVGLVAWTNRSAPEA